MNKSVYSCPRSGIRLITEVAKRDYSHFDDMVYLGYGQPSEPSPNISEYVKFFSGKTQYTLNAGCVELRQTFAKSIPDACVHQDQIIVTNGATQALASAIGCLINHGDKVLIPVPGYPNYRSVVEHYGGVPCYYFLSANNGFAPNVADIVQQIKQGVKAIIINSPSNPTGSVIDQQTLIEIVKYCVMHDVFVISDEVYNDLIYDGEHFYPLSLSYENVVSLFSMSKVYNLCGMRIGFAATKNLLLYESMIKSQEMYVSCANSIAQFVCSEVIKNEERYKQVFRLTYQNKMQKAIQEFGDLLSYKPSAAFYFMVDISSCGLGAKDFCFELLDKQHVVVSPGYAFGPTCDKFVRVSLTEDWEKAQIGIMRLKAFIEEQK